ncbi:ceramide synthase Lac1p [Trichomonascus vanleenenianus]|uniref:ceramide synthase Lac1p n=1 Tax=Trichomonascus vanleenenianus TaxID=2268995 RepID=UPI003EC9D9F9
MARRPSQVGDIGLGDTSGAGLSTRHTAEQARASRSRQRALSGARTVKSPSGKLKVVPTGEPKASGLRRLRLSYQELTYRNTWMTPLLVMAAVYGWFFLMTDRSENTLLHRFLCLSYRIEGTDPVHYGKGKKDFAFVAFHMIFFTFFREFCMQMILRPIARNCGLKKSKMNRFMEQSYSIIYYSLSGSFGLYIMYHSPLWFFETVPMYEHFPHKTHEALFKLFYLLQASFWAQQSVILMLQVEKPRKDFKELVFHHVVTMALIFLSYRFHFTWMGLGIYITMDISDVFLATSKVLNYLDSAITGPFFIFFMGAWIYTRHYLNIKVLYSILTEFATVGDFELNWETQQYKCWISQYITFALLLALQLVNLYWLFLILRIAYRYVFHNIQKDERSDDEEDDDEDYSPESSPVDEKKKEK